MSELEPSAKPQTSIDVLHKLEQTDFFHRVAEIEDHLQHGDDIDKEVAMLDELRTSFGQEYENHDATVTADAYIRYDSGATSQEAHLLEEVTLSFVDIDIKLINDRRRIVFDFTDNKMETNFLVVPYTVSKLDIISPKHDINIQEFFGSWTTKLKGYINSQEFQRVPAYEQQEGLRAACNDILSDLRLIFGTTPVTVDCQEYYVVHDQPSFDFDDMYIEQTHTSDQAETQVLNGIVADVTFLEQVRATSIDMIHFSTSTPGIKSISEMPFSHGVPCIVLRNEADGSLAFVQLDQIENIGLNQTDQ